MVASLCWLLRKTGSLLPPFVAHATFNAFAATLLVLGGLGLLPESEQRSYSTHTFTQGDSVYNMAFRKSGCSYEPVAVVGGQGPACGRFCLRVGNFESRVDAQRTKIGRLPVRGGQRYKSHDTGFEAAVCAFVAGPGRCGLPEDW